mmetsp:Transcript_1295/g.3717  ORF Transcript_1295/g.3717 Transcript_1295/m.3717 type:complete len:478 (-) Transcript_1295:46-1479(-)
MVLKLSLVLDRPSYRPGNLLGAIVEVANVPIGSDNESEVSVELAALEIHCEGTEYVDPHWVAATYHADTPGIGIAGRRRTERHIFHASVKKTPNAILTPSTKRRFYVSMRLPENLPPSFRGTAARFSYQMRAIAKEVAPKEVEAADVATPFVPSVNGLANGVELPPHTVKVQFIIWPPSKHGSSRSRSVFDGAAAFHIPADFFGEIEVPVVNYRIGAGSQSCSFHATEISQEDPNFNVSMFQSADKLRASTGDSHQIESTIRPSESGSVAEDDVDEASTSRLHSHLSLDSTYNSTPGTSLLHQQTSNRSYNLRIGDHPLVKFSLHSSQEGPIHPGSTFSGMLDFQCSHGQGQGMFPRCVQLLVLLETEECLNPEWTASSTTSPSSSGLPTIRKVYDEYVELTQDTLLTHFMFTIPADSPASFATPLVALRWVLRFELSALYIGVGEGGARTLSSKQPVEKVSWVLPVPVYPPSPGYK